MNSLSDIYDAQLGDTLVFDNSVDSFEIYRELLTNEKKGVLNSTPDNTQVLTFVDELSMTDFAKILCGSNFNNEDTLSIKIPDGMKPESLKSVVYKHMREAELKYKLTTGLGVITANRRQTAFVSMQRLFNNLKVGDDPRKLPLTKVRSISSTISRIYRTAVELGVVVKVSSDSTNILITKVSDSRDNDSGNFFAELKNWIAGLDYDKQTKIPSHLLEGDVSVAYIKTVISKSGFDCKYSKGWVTKVSVALRRKAGKIDLCAGGRVLKTFDTARVCHLTSKDRALINLLIKPYGKTFEEL